MGGMKKKSRKATATTEKIADETKLSSRDSITMTMRYAQATAPDARSSRKHTQVTLARATQPKIQSAARRGARAARARVTRDISPSAPRSNQPIICPTHRSRQHPENRDGPKESWNGANP